MGVMTTLPGMMTPVAKVMLIKVNGGTPVGKVTVKAGKHSLCRQLA